MTPRTHHVQAYIHGPPRLEHTCTRVLVPGRTCRVYGFSAKFRRLLPPGPVNSVNCLPCSLVVSHIGNHSQLAIAATWNNWFPGFGIDTTTRPWMDSFAFVYLFGHPNSHRHWHQRYSYSMVVWPFVFKLALGTMATGTGTLTLSVGVVLTMFRFVAVHNGIVFPHTHQIPAVCPKNIVRVRVPT